MIFFLFLFGLAIGSFINVVVYRLNHHKSPLVGRSFCPKCKHQLAWRDNIPLVSFALLRGRCRYCHAPISWQYPLVELTAALLTLLIYFSTTHPWGVLRTPQGWLWGRDLLITYSLLAIFVSDWRYMIIPDEVLVFAGVASFFYLVSQPPNILIANILAAFGAAGFFGLLVLSTKGRGMGLGDVKLAGLMGLILGWPQVAVALFLAFLTGAMVGVILILLGKKRFGQQVPFGPFLAAAMLTSLLLGQPILNFYLQWFLR